MIKRYAFLISASALVLAACGGGDSKEKKTAELQKLKQEKVAYNAEADKKIAALEKELNIKMGETTPDGKFALEFAECVGQCQATPVITINSKPYLDVTPDKIAGILAEYK